MCNYSNKKLDVYYHCNRAIIEFHRYDGNITLWNNPPHWYPNLAQFELYSVIVEHYPEKNQFGIYGFKSTVISKQELLKHPEISEQICNDDFKYVPKKTLKQWFLRKPSTKTIRRIKPEKSWYNKKKLNDFRLIIRDDELTIVEGASPSSN
jgi:hypothetical protein